METSLATNFVILYKTTWFPILQPFNDMNDRSVVVVDNMSIHQIDMQSNLTNWCFGKVLPPYSPDLNPIEEVLAKVKSFLNPN